MSGSKIDRRSKRRRKKPESTSSFELPINMISIKEKLPPSKSRTLLLVLDDIYGYDVLPAHLVYEHIMDDIERDGKPRVTHWGLIKQG